VPADLISADEQPDANYPMVLITGRQLEHWHTGAMTRRAGVLDAIEPEPTASFHPLDLDGFGAMSGEGVTVASRPDRYRFTRVADAALPGGRCSFLLLYEAAANKLTNPGLDSVRQDSRISSTAPVKVTKGAGAGCIPVSAPASRYGAPAA